MVRELVGAAIELGVGEPLRAGDEREGRGRAVDLGLEEIVEAGLRGDGVAARAPGAKEARALVLREDVDLADLLLEDRGTATSSVVSWRRSRSIVAPSKRSVLNSIEPTRRPSISLIKNVRSYLAVVLPPPRLRISRPGRARPARGAFAIVKMTWKSGARLRSAAGASSWTRRSKGMSWWA